MSDATNLYDVCIIGSGPAGLAALSGVREPYSIDNLNDTQVNRAVHSLKLHQRLKVAVVDVHDTWLESWKQNFATLDIEFLRSPVVAHPDLFDTNALLAYAVAHDRMNELHDTGCIDGQKLLAMGQPQPNLWKLPSTKLFYDFCQDLAKSLPHDYLQGKITSISRQKTKANQQQQPFQVELHATDSDTERRMLSAKAIILATGPTGHPIIPPGLQSVTRDNEAGRLLLWPELDQKLRHESNRILVVGGGLTAVQVALRLVKMGKQTTLCSRRPLMEKHFDIGLEWFEMRTANKCMSDFYHQAVSDRLRAIKQVRGGGSVPPLYMRDVEKAERMGQLIRMVGKVQYNDDNEDTCNEQVCIAIESDDNDETKTVCVDQIVVACGIQPDCSSNPVVKSVMEQWPVPIEGGLPSVTEDLRWKDRLPLYVVGSLGALNTGPDAGNIMGVRRAAQLIANGLDCRCWLRQKALINPFEVLLLGDSSSSDEETNSETDISDEEED